MFGEATGFSPQADTVRVRRTRGSRDAAGQLRPQQGLRVPAGPVFSEDSPGEVLPGPRRSPLGGNRPLVLLQQFPYSFEEYRYIQRLRQISVRSDHWRFRSPTVEGGGVGLD